MVLESVALSVVTVMIGCKMRGGLVLMATDYVCDGELVVMITDYGDGE